MDAASRLTTKGQVTIPKAVREALGLTQGDAVVFRVEGQRAVLARTPDVLESYYEVERARVAELVRAIIAFDAVRVVDEELLLRAVEVYEIEGLDFAEAYLVASAERSGVDTVASFDRSIDRVTTIRRIEPGR